MTIGIVTISFNQGKYLQDAISTVKVSGRHSLEYVIVDPGSTDETAEIIDKNRTAFSRIIREPDDGPADGLNKGFSELRQAEICGYLNADDRFAAGALDFVAQYFDRNPGIDILLGSILILDRAGKVNLRGRMVNKVTPFLFAEKLCLVWQQATFFRRSIFERVRGFNKQNRISWDSELIIDMLLAGARVGYTERALGEFRIYGESITGSMKTKHLAEARRQHRLVQQKIRAAGYGSLPVAVSNALQMIHKVNPLRHASNLMLGLNARKHPLVFAPAIQQNQE